MRTRRDPREKRGLSVVHVLKENLQIEEGTYPQETGSPCLESFYGIEGLSVCMMCLTLSKQVAAMSTSATGYDRLFSSPTNQNQPTLQTTHETGSASGGTGSHGLPGLSELTSWTGHPAVGSTCRRSEAKD